MTITDMSKIVDYIGVMTTVGNEDDYISLTDMARHRNPEFPADVVKNWLRLRSTIEFLGLWEQLNNPDFKVVEFDQFKNDAGSNAFVLSPQKWIKETNAEVADRVTVLRKGKCIGTVNVNETSEAELSRMMVGRDVQLVVDKDEAHPAQTVLQVENLTMSSKRHSNNAVKNVSFDVKAGEIVCIAGIEGNGQTELVYGITGLEPVTSGKITLSGEDITNQSIRQRSAKMSHIPEDRHKYASLS